MRKKGLWVLSICSLLLGACAPSRNGALPASVTASPSPFVMFFPVPTATSTPTATPTLTPTPTPTPTLTLTFPVLVGIPYSTSAATISAENVEQLRMVALWSSPGVDWVRWSPDGRYIAASAAEGVRLYDISGGTRRSLLLRARAAYIAFSPDSRLLAVAVLRTVSIFHVEDGSLMSEMSDFATDVSGVDFSPDGTRLAVGLHNGEGQIRRVEDGSLLQKCRKITSRLLVRFLPDGQRLLFAGGDYQQVWLWNLETDEIHPVARGYTRGISEIAITKDGQLLVVVGYGFGEITVWQMDTERQILKVPLKQWHAPAEVTPDGRMLVILKEGSLEVWNLTDGRLVGKVESPAGIGFSSLAFSPDGQMLVAGSNKGLYFWRVEGETLTDAGGGASSQDDFAIRCFFWYDPKPCLDTAVSSSGEELVAVASDYEVDVWRLSDGALVRTFQNNSEWKVDAMALSRDGRFLAMTAGSRIILWNLETGEEHALLRGHRHLVSILVFSPNGEQLISSADGLARVWRVSDGRFLFDMEKPTQGSLTALAVSPNGQFVAGGTAEGVIYIWQASNGMLLSVIRENKGKVSRLSFSPDSRMLLASFDKAVEIWRVYLGKVELLQTWPGSTNAMFSPSGELVFAVTSCQEKDVWWYTPCIQIRRSSDGTVLRTLPGRGLPLKFSSRGDLLIVLHVTRIGLPPWSSPFLSFWQVVP